MNIQDILPEYHIDNSFLDGSEAPPNSKVYTIFLNRPFEASFINRLNTISTFKIMADGAANHFHDHFLDNKIREILPNAIVGDLDSIRDEVVEYYKSLDVKIHKNPSQDDSDLEKCLNYLLEHINSGEIEEETSHKIAIVGALGGRMDHTLNNIHILHKFCPKFAEQVPNVNILLMDDNSLATCILPGKTVYKKAREFELTTGCGLFPLIGAANMKTKGFKWNLDETTPKLNFKAFISSSNEFVDETIEFETDEIVLFTTTNKLHEKAKKL